MRRAKSLRIGVHHADGSYGDQCKEIHDLQERVAVQREHDRVTQRDRGLRHGHERHPRRVPVYALDPEHRSDRLDPPAVRDEPAFDDEDALASNRIRHQIFLRGQHQRREVRGEKVGQALRRVLEQRHRSHPLPEHRLRDF
eukprot:31028-Pelagococcus_subviridis.AAC.4